MNTFAARIKQYRKDKKLTQAQLAGLLDVSLSTVSNYEQGRSRPDGKNDYLAYALKMGINQSWLQEGRGDPYEGAPVLALSGESKELQGGRKNSHTEPIQSDIGLSGGGDEIIDDTSTIEEERERMELPRGGSLTRLNVPQYFDIWMLGEVIATVEFARIIPGKRKGVDITKAAFDMRYSPHDYPEIEEGSPVNNDE